MRASLSTYRFELALFTASVVAVAIAAEFEFFERFHAFSRAHDDWDLDEFAIVFVVASLALPIYMWRANARLQSAMRETERAQEKAHRMSRHDPLTGLGNRRFFSETLLDTLSREAEGIACLLLIDLDRFKQINDMRGHEAGDLLLRAVADRLRDACRDGQVPARLGGDEFGVVLRDGAGGQDATALARRIISTLERPVEFPDWSARIGCSIGICHWQPAMDETALMRAADQAMYRAKAEGRGRYSHFDDALGEKLMREAVMETELRHAIETGAIQPAFQPIVDLATMRISGFEVLSRWSSERLGDVPPAVFIPMAEDIGMIGPLTWQVLDQACTVAAGWDSSLSLAVNLSPRQFADDELIDRIRELLSRTGFAPDRLEIEITENAVIEDMQTASRAIRQLKALGIRLSLDDFGTGYSSLATLSGLEFDRIKIDRSFIDQVTERPQNAQIVSGILALAGSLELDVTAEGIETRTELDFLIDRGCRNGQGFLFDRPMRVSEIERILARDYGHVFSDRHAPLKTA